MQRVIELKERISTHSGGRYFRTVNGGYYVNRLDLIDLIRSGAELIFHGSKSEERELLECLRAVEDAKEGDTAMMNRILRNDGFIEYIKKLEARL